MPTKNTQHGHKFNLPDIVLIGAGPAGMAAALEGRRLGARVALYDANPAPGRKLLVTGSGHCNITNSNAAAERYPCADQGWLTKVFAAFGHRDLLAFLDELGIPTQATTDGWFYPVSNSAQSVVDVFTSALQLAGVDFFGSTRITQIRTSRQGFSLGTRDGQWINAPRVVLASGGKAQPDLGSDGALFPELEKLGHTVLPIHPALAPIKADLGAFKELQGVRLDVGASVWKGSRCLGKSLGNLIVTAWGFNGPAVMDLSHWVSLNPGDDLRLELDLVVINEEVLNKQLKHQRTRPVPLKVVLGAVMPPKAAPVLIKLAGLPPNVTLTELSDREMENVLTKLKHLSFVVHGTRGFEFCQLKTGGVPVNEVTAATMQSLQIPGLFLAGEVLDVVGPCGGYNLQFAFSSGVLAGRGAASVR